MPAVSAAQVLNIVRSGAPTVVPPPLPAESLASLLHGLNRQQRQAVTHLAGPLVVLAGPGTGKTELITRRIAWLIATKHARPREILALTFTDNAASEMQSRVDVLVPYGQADTHIHTFHAFGDRLLREFSLELGLPGDVRLLGRAEQIVLLRDHLFELGLDRYRPLGDPTRFLEALAGLFVRAKDEDLSPEVLADHAAQLLARAEDGDTDDAAALRDLAAARSEVAVAYRRYVDLLARNGCIDHADQIALPLRLLRERPSIRQEMTGRFRYVLVDELQDTNRAQLELVRALTGIGGNVTAVGDADQGIYGFRGAQANNVKRFAAMMPGARTIVLGRNYRSRQPIVEAAARLVGASRTEAILASGAVATAQRKSKRAAPVRCHTYANGEEEADAIAVRIADRIASGERPSDFAVLVRSNGETDPIMRSLRVRGVAADDGARTNIFELPAVRALLAYLRVVADQSSNLELYLLAAGEPYQLDGAVLSRLMHVSRRGHQSVWDVLTRSADGEDVVALPPDQQRRAQQLVEHVRAGIEESAVRSSGEVLYGYLRRSGLLARLARLDSGSADVTGLRGIARFFEIVQRRASLLSEDRVPFLVPHLEVSLEGGENLDAGDPNAEWVSVLTVHRAKGLEFKVVFMAGLVDGRFPVRARPPALSLPPELLARHATGDDEHLDEERRLFYVAMTRARDELHLSYYTTGRNGRGRCRPSPFIAEALDLPAARALQLPAPAAPTVPLPQPVPAVTPSTDAPAHAPSGGPLALSYSQVDDYLSCPERYRLRYVVGIPTPAHHALAYGSAMHKAAAAFHVSQARGMPLSEEELLAEFAQSWTPEGFLSREHEEVRYKAGQEALRRFRSEQLISGAAAPTAVERPFVFQLGADVVRGRMDRVDEGPGGTVITDYKTSDVRDQKRADTKARESLQLQVYALAHQAQTGAPPREVRLHFLDSGIVGRTSPDPARLEKARAKLLQTAADIRAERFEPKPNPVACGYCPFRTICRSSAA